MHLNCQAGELAIFIGEGPGCERKSGRCVRVQHTLRETPWGLMWHVIPEGDPHWVCVHEDGTTTVHNALETRVFIPDAFLLSVQAAPSVSLGDDYAEQAARLISKARKGATK